MNPILAASILICIVGVGEIVAARSKAVISTMLFVGIITMIAFWFGLPTEIFAASGILSIAGLSVGLLLTNMGTLIVLEELIAQWKTIIIGFCAAISITIVVMFVGPIFIDQLMAYSAAPIVAGGVVAQLAVSEIMRAREMFDVEIFCLIVLVLQNLVGIPITSIILKREAKRFLGSDDYDKYLNQTVSGKSVTRKKLIPPLPELYRKPAFLLGKASIVAFLGFYLSGLTGGKINALLICLILGVIFTELGFLENNILEKANASGFVLPVITLVVFQSVAKATPELVSRMLLPTLIVLSLGVLAIVLSGFVTGKLLKVNPYMAIAIGLTALYGFPATFYISKEVSEAVGNNEEERKTIEAYILPKMVTAGFATVTIASVIIVGFIVNVL